MDRLDLLEALRTVLNAVPESTPKVTREALQRIISLTEVSDASSLVELGKDFAKNARASRPQADVRHDVVDRWYMRIKSASSQSEFMSVSSLLSAEAKDRKRGTITKAELKEVVIKYAGNKGISGNIDSLIEKLNNKFVQKLLAVN